MEGIENNIKELEDMLKQIREESAQKHESNKGVIEANEARIAELRDSNEKNRVMAEAFEEGEPEYIELAEDINSNNDEIAKLEEENGRLSNVSIDEESKTSIEELKANIVEELKQRSRYLVQNRHISIEEANKQIEAILAQREARKEAIKNKENLMYDKQDAIRLIKENAEINKKIETAKRIIKLEAEQKKLKAEIENDKVQIEMAKLENSGYVGGMEGALKTTEEKLAANEQEATEMRRELGISYDANIMDGIKAYNSTYSVNLSMIRNLGQDKSIEVLEAEIAQIKAEVEAETEAERNNDNNINLQILDLIEIAEIKEASAEKDTLFEEVKKVNSLIRTVQSIDGKSEPDVLNDLKEYKQNVYIKRKNILEEIQTKRAEIEGTTIDDTGIDNDLKFPGSGHNSGAPKGEDDDVKGKREEIYSKFTKLLQSTGRDLEDIERKIPALYEMVKRSAETRDTMEELAQMDDIEKFIVNKIKAESKSKNPKKQAEIAEIKRECDFLGIKYQENKEPQPRNEARKAVEPKTEPKVAKAEPKTKQEQGAKNVPAEPVAKQEQESKATPAKPELKPEIKAEKPKTEVKQESANYQISNPEITKIVIGRTIEINMQGENSALGKVEKVINSIGEEVFDMLYMEDQLNQKAGRPIDKLKYKDEIKSKLNPALVGVLAEFDKYYKTDYVKQYVDGEIDFDIEYNKEKMRGNIGNRIMDAFDFSYTNRKIREDMEDIYFEKDKARLGKKVTMIEKEEKEKKPSFISRISKWASEKFSKSAEMLEGVSSKALPEGRITDKIPNKIAYRMLMGLGLTKAEEEARKDGEGIAPELEALLEEKEEKWYKEEQERKEKERVQEEAKREAQEKDNIRDRVKHTVIIPTYNPASKQGDSKQQENEKDDDIEIIDL